MPQEWALIIILCEPVRLEARVVIAGSYLAANWPIISAMTRPACMCDTKLWPSAQVPAAEHKFACCPIWTPRAISATLTPRPTWLWARTHTEAISHTGAAHQSLSLRLSLVLIWPGDIQTIRQQRARSVTVCACVGACVCGRRERGPVPLLSKTVAPLSSLWLSEQSSSFSVQLLADLHICSPPLASACLSVAAVGARMFTVRAQVV